MSVISRLSLLVCLLLTSHVNYASSYLTHHTLAVGQAMSAFYMFGLTEGDPKYKDQYQQSLKQADRHLNNMVKHEPLLAKDIKARWDELHPHLKYNHEKDYGYYIPGLIQGRFRLYLDFIYPKVKQIGFHETNLPQQFLLLTTNIEVLSGRFFDVASSMDTNEASMLGENAGIDPAKVARLINVKLEKIQAMKMSRAAQDNLKLVRRKWKFIEDSMVNYKPDNAYLAVYYNKVKIFKLISKSEESIAGI